MSPSCPCLPHATASSSLFAQHGGCVQGKCHSGQITTDVSPSEDCSAAGGEGRDAAATGRRLILIIAMIFNTVQLPASLLYTKAHSVIQRDAAITANHFIPGHKSWALQPALEKKNWQKLQKSLSPLSCLLFINSPESLSAPGLAAGTGNPGQDPYLSRAQEQQSPVRCIS